MQVPYFWHGKNHIRIILSILEIYITFAANSRAHLKGESSNENLVEVKLFGCEQPPIIFNNFILDQILYQHILYNSRLLVSLCALWIQYNWARYGVILKSYHIWGCMNIHI
jgi:hypothetical protein